MLKKNLHSHIARCYHARGKDEEYIIRALEAGNLFMGQHFLGTDVHHSIYSGISADSEEVLRKYCQLAIKGLKLECLHKEPIAKLI